MSNNRLPLLVTALVVLLVVAYVSGAFEGNPSTIDVPDVDLAVDAADHISVSGAIDLDLAREDSAWRIVSPVAARADSATVSVLLATLDDLELASVVSTNPDRYGRYGVDSTGVRIDLDGRTIVVSTQGPDFQSNYVRIGDDPVVYATRSRISLSTDPDRWRDRHVLAGVRITSAALRMPDGSYGVERGPGGWQLSGDDSAPADSAAVARWLGRFGNLSADGFLTGVTADSVRATATHVIDLGLADGSGHTLYLLERDDALAAVLDEGPDVFRLFSSRLRSLAPERATLAAD